MKNDQNKFFKQIIKNLPEANDELAFFLKKIESIKNNLAKEIQNNQIPPLNICQKEDDLQEIKNIASNIKKTFQKVVVLGVGGSSLGGRTLTAIKNSPEIEVIFLESIDSNTIKNNLDKIDLKNSCFLVISKSGETVETICQTLITIEKFKNAKISNLENNFIFITGNQQSSIGKIAKKLGSKIYPHPNDIGGRFSYLTIVGLLPASLVGLDIVKIRKGAQEILNNFITNKTDENELVQSCAAQIYLSENGFKSNVVMPYIDNLKDFTDWYRQLWAESLGKNGFGLTPINSMGTIDQHSQLQLYLDGPRDKFFTFITNKNHQFDFQINDLGDCKTLFGNKNLNQILEVEQNTTIEVLSNKKLPIRILETEKIDESVLSALMMYMFLETIIIAKAKNINPFDQPAVELRKDLAKKYLHYN